MNRYIKLSAVILFLILTYIANYLLSLKYSDYHNIAQWSNYILVVPLTFSLGTLISKSISGTSILFISLGGVFVILLDRNVDEKYLILKILVTLVGALITFIIYKKSSKD